METEGGKATSETSKCSRRREEKRGKSLTKVTGTDIGLKIYTPKSRGWAETPLRKNSLLKGIEDKNINWTYTDPLIKEKEIQEKMFLD